MYFGKKSTLIFFCRECEFDGGDCYPQEDCVVPDGIDEQLLGKVFQ